MGASQRVSRGFHQLAVFVAGIPLLMGVMDCAYANENWVCGIPTLVDPAHINLFDFDIAGSELLVKSPGVHKGLP